MPTIFHFFNIKNTDTKKIYEAITTQSGLREWWTTRTIAFPKAGSMLRFDFSDNDFLEFIVKELRNN